MQDMYSAGTVARLEQRIIELLKANNELKERIAELEDTIEDLHESKYRV